MDIGGQVMCVAEQLIHVAGGLAFKPRLLHCFHL